PTITEGESIDVTMSENGSPIDFELILHATDSDNKVTFAWSVTNPPLHGRAFTTAPAPAAPPGCGKGEVCPPSAPSASSDSNMISYSPDSDYNGTDSFDVQ